jgi:hypothetical protein
MFNKPFVFVCLILLSGCGSSKSDDNDTPAPQPTPTASGKTGDVTGTTPILSPSEGIASKNSKFVAKLEWITGPKAKDYVKAKMTFALADRSAPKTLKDIVFDPQMPSMGHGTSTIDQKIEIDATTPYVAIVEGIYFIMGGPWEIRVTATVDDATDMVAIPVDVP